MSSSLSTTRKALINVFKKDSDETQQLLYLVNLVNLIAFLMYGPEFFRSFLGLLFQNFSKENAFFVINVATYSITYLVGHTIMYVIYASNYSFLEQFKISTDQWQWKVDQKSWNMMLKKTLLMVSSRHLLIFPGLTFLDVYLGISVQTDIDESFPTLTQILSQMLVIMMIEDFIFYWSHRLFHYSKIYPYVHKVHHEYTMNISIGAEYDDYREIIIMNIVYFYLSGSTILGNRLHIVAPLMVQIIRIIHNIDNHCGYHFPWNPLLAIPGWATATYHDFHHSANVGNFALYWKFWDWVGGTNSTFDKQANSKKHAKIKVT